MGLEKVKQINKETRNKNQPSNSFKVKGRVLRFLCKGRIGKSPEEEKLYRRLDFKWEESEKERKPWRETRQRV